VILAHYRCPCIACKERPTAYGPLCWLHESMLRGTPHRRYIGLCALFQGSITNANLCRVAGVLARLCAAIGAKEGHLFLRQVQRVADRYQPHDWQTTLRRGDVH
jgi:hypothetical protein